MRNFLATLTPEDVLAFMVVLGCFVAKFKGFGQGSDNIISAVVGYRLGHHVTQVKNK